MYVYLYIYIYMYVCMYIYSYVYIYTQSLTHVHYTYSRSRRFWLNYSMDKYIYQNTQTYMYINTKSRSCGFCRFTVQYIRTHSSHISSQNIHLGKVLHLYVYTQKRKSIVTHSTNIYIYVRLCTYMRVCVFICDAVSHSLTECKRERALDKRHLTKFC